MYRVDLFFHQRAGVQIVEVPCEQLRPVGYRARAPLTCRNHFMIIQAPTIFSLPQNALIGYRVFTAAEQLAAPAPERPEQSLGEYQVRILTEKSKSFKPQYHIENA